MRSHIILVVLEPTHSTPPQEKDKFSFGKKKKGNFGIFDPAFYFSSFLSAVLKNSLQTGGGVIFHALKSA